jgi:GT2 family glycosyltransferase
LNRIRGLFHRYERRHRQIVAAGFPLPGVAGHVDRVLLQGARVTFVGWSTADRIVLVGADGQSAVRPQIARQDVADSLGLPAAVGFEISQPYGSGTFTLSAESGGTADPVEVTPIPAARLIRHRLGLALRFAATVAGLTPDIAAALLRHDPAARTRIKTALGLHAVIPDAGPLEPALFDGPGTPAPDLAPEPGPITLILPVYNAFGLLPEVLDRVLRHTDLPWHLIVIEDCSTDPAVRPWLIDWVATQDAVSPGRITLILNDTNRGFIGSVNDGLARALTAARHVVLLNSDAFVPPGWASRLLRPILRDPDVASVTPMSNDAEVLSVPVICARGDLAPGQGDAIDAQARQLSPDATVALPTGVGFYMAMNIRFLRKIPLLDPVFGRGYGEEVDWCQKARALGGRHLGLPSLFVEHRGGTSFGSEEKLRLVLRNNRVIAGRYPRYDAEVQQVIAADPLVTARLALALAWAGSGGHGPIPVYLAHALGGGAENYLERRIADDLAATGRPSVVLRVGGALRWQVEVVSDQGVVAGGTDDFALVERLLEPLAQRHIVYSCGVGDADPVTLPDHLLALKTGPQDRIEVLVHDYFMLSPSYTLLDGDGVYRGPLTAPRTDPAHGTRRPDGTWVTPQDWQVAWARLLQAADEVVCFSPDSQAQILAACPGLAARVALRPHQLPVQVPDIVRTLRGGRRVIGVLGNIGYQKGAAVLVGMGRMLERDGDMGLVLIGNVDPAWMPPASVPVHGDYRVQDLPGLVARYGITDWLIPSVWPETFSYTTHECLATGLPVHAFDIGAQGAAVRAAQNGHVIAFTPDGDLAQTVLDAVRETSLTQG